MMPSREERLLDLIDRWRDLRAEGASVSVDQLCVGCPDLADDLRHHISLSDGLERVAAPDQAALDTNPFEVSTAQWEAARRAALPGDEAPPEVPGYTELVWLGQGGMGVVFRGWHMRLDRPVALKVVRAEELTTSALARLQAEARAVAQLDHPNIVKVFEVGECKRAGDGARVPFIALEFVAGGSLEKRLGRERLDPAEAAWLVRLLARAMHHAHRRGVVHRDLKPDNVLLAEATDEPALNTALGCPKVTDFGLARSVSADERMTQSGAIVGTPAYMAPEQADGKKDIGPAADVYALGAILYRLLAGKPPFQAASVIDLLYQVRHEPPAPVRAARPEVPAGLEAVCLECLEKSPTKRPSAADLANRLDPFVSGGAPTSRTVPTGWRWSTALAGLAALVLVGIGGWLLTRPSGTPDGAGGADPAPTSASANLHYRGQIDVRIEREIQPEAPQLVRLDDPRAPPMRWSDRFRVEATVEPPAYLYIVWVDPGKDVTPVYPWDPTKGWGTRPAQEGLVGKVSLPPNAGDRFTAPKAKPGVATMVVLARPTPLDVSDRVVRGWFESLPDLPLPPGGERGVVWFDDYVAVTGEARRKRTFQVESSNDPFARWQGLLQKAVADRAAFQTAVSFARTCGQ